ncbi:extracellular solute-binding protein [Paenibacillus sp.]|uniref:extracellular solute-binding protein n=1 Tax=Paenibacillus sp. TaxID=58172 RepID=UPI002811723C|nr:extracellular solute-binding protein [Paenibacillus sp.]
MRTWIRLAFIALLAVSVSACGATTGTTNDTAGGSGTAEGTTENRPSAGEAVTFNILRNFNSPEYPADGGPAKKIILEQLKEAGIDGVDYNVQLASGDEYTTKLNLLAASGELPDFFSVDLQTMTRYADEGLIQPLDDLLEQAPELMKLIRQEDLENLKYNGKIYGLPVGYRPEPFNGPNTNGLVIRKDWLDNLNLQEPKTLDELHEVLRAFTFDDPDRNGQDDTYGLSATKTTNFSFIFGAFGIAPANGNAIYWTERNGELKPGFTVPEAKEALAMIQAWYKEGLIDPEFPVMETKQLQEKVINSRAGIYEGSAFDGDPKQPINASLTQATPGAVLKLITPPAGPNGHKGLPESSPSYGDVRSISAKAKHPEKLMELINWSAGPGFNLVTYGVEGTHVELDDANNKVTMLVESYSDLYKEGFSNPIRFVQIVDRRWMAEDAIEGMYITNDPENLIENAFWKTVPALLDYPDLTKLWSEYFAKIVTGAYSVDRWEEFVERFYEQGGQVIEQQVNEARNK